MYNNDKKWLGTKFKRLTIIGFEKCTPPNRGWKWVVKCDCGNIKSVTPYDVKSGKITSCGCFAIESRRERARKFKHSVADNKRLYSIYNGIKKRCYNKDEPRYKDYGKRGIIMCDEWLNPTNGFDNFVEWSLSNGYNETLTIERKDVNGDYSPTNCEWITLTAQALNKRDTIWVKYKGRRIQLHELCKEKDILYDTVHNRIFALGWDIERAIDTKSQQTDSLRSKCIEKGINYSTVRDRINKFGWSEEDALNIPSMGRGANRKTHKV